MVARSRDARSRRHIEPMLCTLVKEPPANDEYLFEVKWDGYRILAFVEDGSVSMNSRSGLDYTSRYPGIKKALQGLGHDVILDGEVVVFNEEGKPDFDALQLYNGKTSPIKYCVFDLLSLDGNDLTELPLLQRKELLKALVANKQIFQFSESFDNGNELYQKALDDNLEGIVAKARHSPYLAGSRGNEWLKIPTRKRQEFVIGGWAESSTSRSFKSLLFGAYENGEFIWIGRSGGGYKNHEMPGILQKLKAIEIDKPPFKNKVLDTKGAKTHYVKPELVANFEFATWTRSGRIRKPATFLGFRFDKDPKQVVREVPKDTDAVVEELEQNQNGNDEAKESPELTSYRDKRRFNQTPEPEGGKPKDEQLIFVVQKHHASHLHYDFRLEMRGVLKSWAVPKGPSLDPDDRRLAMSVEDHPYDYKDFEGIIPKGQYGGGTVIVWDRGTYEPSEKIKGKKEQEHWLLSHYYKNALSIRLNGQKLKGEFTIVRANDGRENAWYLSKAKDKYARKGDIRDKDKSVISGLTIEEMQNSDDPRVWQSNRSESGDKEDITPKDTKAETVGALYGASAKYGNWKVLFDEKISSQGHIEIEGHGLELTNIEKELWKQTTKAQLIAYYNSVADLILPYLKDRPLSLLIQNVNANTRGLYIKDMEGHQPPYVDIFADKRRVPKPGKRSVIDYPVCNNKAALLYFVNLGCIDMNPWSARVSNPSELDYISIDLDPSVDDFKKVIHTAQAVKEVLDKHKLSSVVKTSGKTGLHIFIPCRGFDNATAKQLGKIVYQQAHELVPDITTDTVSKKQRGDKVYVDYTLNDYADTLASAYSVRPHHIPTVSTPLNWKEVNERLDPGDFRLDNVMDRFEKVGDLFADLLDEAIAVRNSKKLGGLL